MCDIYVYPFLALLGLLEGSIPLCDDLMGRSELAENADVHSLKGIDLRGNAVGQTQEERLSLLGILPLLETLDDKPVEDMQSEIDTDAEGDASHGGKGEVAAATKGVSTSTPNHGNSQSNEEPVQNAMLLPWQLNTAMASALSQWMLPFCYAQQQGQGQGHLMPQQAIHAQQGGPSFAPVPAQPSFATSADSELPPSQHRPDKVGRMSFYSVAESVIASAYRRAFGLL